MALRSSDDYRRQKELDEARKAGLAPAELDEDGKEINPHIPQYMTNAPWYLNTDKPTLKHQRNWKEQLEDNKQWYDRGVKVFQATKYRKGACENCGSMSHKTADCLERPRAKGARWTNKHIAPDEKVQEVEVAGFAAKRDRYNGYDARDYARVVERYEAIEALRKESAAKASMEEAYAAGGGGGGAGEGGAADGDEAKLADEETAAFGDVKKRVRTVGGGSSGSVRNLRIREDTAKYLLNLDLNSAYYDPKTRAMREDPQPHKDPKDKTFAGDNFVRTSGDAAAWQALNMHALQAYDRGQEVHTMALPSLAEKMYEQFKSKKAELTGATKKQVLSKYGNAGEAPPEDALLLGQTEAYVEYDRSGRLVKGVEARIRSRYEEDVLVNNHTSVWGSWWSDGQWGYACCHQCVRNSYCTGAAGEAAAAAVTDAMAANLEAKAAADAAMAAADAERRAASTLSNAHLEGRDTWGEAAPAQELDEAKLAAALAAQAAADAAGREVDERKRKYNSLEADKGGVTAEEMEAYRLKKARGREDPVAAANGASGTDGYDLL